MSIRHIALINNSTKGIVGPHTILCLKFILFSISTNFLRIRKCSNGFRVFYNISGNYISQYG